jgi:hypothetical protein
MWLSDVLDDNRYVKVPCSYGFVIRCGHETPVLVNEGDGINGAQVLIVLLSDLACVHVILDE